MALKELIDSRHSIRRFKNKPVPEEKLNQILNAARRAPSAGNIQAYQIVVIKDKNKEGLYHAGLKQEAIKTAPVVLVFLADLKASAIKYGYKGEELYAVQDATIACAYAQLMVEEIGLNCVWIGAFYEEGVKKLVKAGPDLKPVTLLPIGYADEKPIITNRRELREFVHYEEIR
jgi:nitroreductase